MRHTKHPTRSVTRQTDVFTLQRGRGLPPSSSHASPLFTETDFDGHVSQVSPPPTNPKPPSNPLTSRHCRREGGGGSGEGCLTQPQPQVSTRQRPPPPEPLLESRSSSFKVPSWLSAAILRCHYVNSTNLCDECPRAFQEKTARVILHRKVDENLS